MCIFTLIKAFWDVKEQRPNDIKPAHGMMYFYIINLANRLNWIDNFGLPTDSTMEACGINSYKLYKKTLTDLCDFGLIKMVETSKNQFTCNRIALVKKTKALTKALTKASSTHEPKQVEYNNTNKEIQNNKDYKELVSETSSPTKKPKSKKRKEVDLSQYTEEQQNKFNGLEKWIEENTYNLRTIPEQLNIDEFYRLFKDGYTWSEISKVLLEMHNRPEYCQPKKTFSVNLTARNWMDSNRKRDKEQQQKSFKNQPNEQHYTPRISKSEWESKTGRKYEGQDDPNA